MRKEVGKVQKEITALKKAKKDAAELIAKKKAMETEIPKFVERKAELQQERDKLLNLLGNEVDPDVPVSQDEANNAVIRTWGDDACKVCSRCFHPGPKCALHHRSHQCDGDLAPQKGKETDFTSHNELLWKIGGYEPERGADCAGHRGYYLTGPGQMLNFALISYGLDFLRKRTYTSVQEVMGSVAQLEDYDEQLYKLEEDKYLIATAEQPMCAYYMNSVMEPQQLPVRFAAVSPCFRKEAGSHGKDNWGIFRVHQFEKVEQFCITAPGESVPMQEEMIKAAEEFYQSLKLPYQVVTIVSGELNNAATKKYDLEAWFPGYQAYRELVSCSNCTDYQSRAMNIAYGSEKLPSGERQFVHMLNSTLCATTRALCCVLENYAEADGVRVPDVLVPYMGGQTFIPFVRKYKPPKELTGGKGGKAGKSAKGGAGGGGKGGKAAKPAADKPAAAKPAAEKPAAAKPAESKPTGAKQHAIKHKQPKGEKKETERAKPEKRKESSKDITPVAPKPQVKAVVSPAAPAGKLLELRTPAGFADADERLKLNSYFVGYSPSVEDEAIYNTVVKHFGDSG
ncbi:unnamed protein product [Symbiodinium sp. KB8]|nr:unnamed protein product [Symbiodinium sp. KB8]